MFFWPLNYSWAHIIVLSWSKCVVIRRKSDSKRHRGTNEKCIPLETDVGHWTARVLGCLRANA